MLIQIDVDEGRVVDIEGNNNEYTTYGLVEINNDVVLIDDNNDNDDDCDTVVI